MKNKSSVRVHFGLSLGLKGLAQESGFKIVTLRDAWVAQSVKHPTLDFSSGHDLRFMISSPMSGSALSMEPA